MTLRLVTHDDGCLELLCDQCATVLASFGTAPALDDVMQASAYFVNRGGGPHAKDNVDFEGTP